LIEERRRPNERGPRAYFCAEDGVVLHQPLNLQIFLKNRKNGQKMNGISVSRSPKTQNAPTWQVENTTRRRLFLRYFGLFFDLSMQHHT